VLGAAPSNNGSAQPPDCKPRLPITVGREQLHFDLVFCDLSVVNSIPDLTQLDGPQVQFVAKTVTDIQALIRDLIGKKGTEKTIKALESTAIALAVFLDPPLDTISHQVQFIVLWNASANPSWTLLHFKGPSPSSGSMFSATKTSTHTLNIVLGPPSSPDLLNAISALQIGTAVSNAVNTAPTSPH
jgi:hypothetical protein